MKKEENKRKNKIPPAPDFLPEEEASRLFEQISSELEFSEDSPSSRCSRHSGYGYRIRFIARYYGKRMIAVAAALGIFAFGGAGVTQTPSISHVSAASVSDYTAAQVTFHIDALFPVRDISAKINDTPVSVSDNGNQDYSVEVAQNGYLLIEAVSVSGVRSAQGIEIDSIDDKAPVIITHYQSGGQICIQVADEGGAGVNYADIKGISGAGSEVTKPVSYDRKSGTVVFDYPREDTYIIIPDMLGNELIALFKPGENSVSPKDKD